MSTVLLVIQIILSVGIITAVLLQPQGTGLGSVWGGGGETYHTKRGLEKALFYTTILLIALFVLNGIAVLVI